MRYAVIDKDEDGVESLAYLVGNRNAAESLAGEPGSRVVAVSSKCKLRTRNGIPVDDDGRMGGVLLEEIRPFIESSSHVRP